MSRPFKVRYPIQASEHKIQVRLMDYLAATARPEVYYFAIPNQSNRHISNAAKMAYLMR
jgi:hypothetical protein